MAFGQTQTAAPQEDFQNSLQPQVEKKSNLSEIAQYVKPFLDIATQYLRDANLVVKANELITAKVDCKDPQVIDFAIECRRIEGEIISGLRQEKGEDPKRDAVFHNYFSKLTKAVGVQSTEVVEPEDRDDIAPDNSTAPLVSEGQR